jgi:hypothetical protein
MVHVRGCTAGTFVKQRRESSDKYSARNIVRSFRRESTALTWYPALLSPRYELQVSSDVRTRSASEPKLDDRACGVESLLVIARSLLRVRGVDVLESVDRR